MDRCADCGRVSNILRDGLCGWCYKDKEDGFQEPEQHEDEW